MHYITINDLTQTIRRNVWKVPHDINCIIGVPRSGMICASIIASYLNLPLIDVDSFIEGHEPWGGERLQYYKANNKSIKKALIIDDTVSTGKGMLKMKDKLSNIKTDYQFIYGCVYLEGRADWAVDIYLEDVRKYTENFTKFVIYEWNIMQHHPPLMSKSLYDMDGVLCLDPPDERNTALYEAYIRNAVPLFIPRTKIGGIVTFRLTKYKVETEKWLKDNGVQYGSLTMFKAKSYDERNKMNIHPGVYKGEYYKQHPQYGLFVESSDEEAQIICKVAKKPVYCVSTNKLYQ